MTAPKSVADSIVHNTPKKIKQHVTGPDRSVSHLDSSSSMPLDVRLPTMNDQLNNKTRPRMKTLKTTNLRPLSELKDHQDNFRN